MHRKGFLKIMAFLPLLSEAKGLEKLFNSSFTFEDTDTMPVFFIGHGNPQNAFRDNPFTQSLRKMGESLKPKPSAILVISAHWLSMDNTFISAKKQFVEPDYPAVGAPELARSIKQTIPSLITDTERDLDHGAWTILRHISPGADIPVLEMSIDMNQPLDYHWNLSQKLKVLRNKGVLIIGSGNIVHNLDLSILRFYTKKPFDWAIEFDEWVKGRIMERDFFSLFGYNQLGKLASKAVPTADHYIPMLYSVALAGKNDPITYTYEEVYSGVSMRCFRIG